MPAGERQDLRAEPDHHRDTEPAGHDRGVRGRRAAGQREARHRPVELRHVGGAEVVGDHDHVTRQVAGRLAGAAHAAGGAAAERADVVGARGQSLVGQRGDRVRVDAAGRDHGRRGVAPVFEHGALQRDVERRVGRHQHAGLDDLRLALAPLGAQPRRQRIELGAGVGQRRPCGLQRRGASGLGQRSAAAGRRVEHAGASGSDAGRGGEPGEDALGHQPAGSRARPSAAMISVVEVAPGS